MSNILKTLAAGSAAGEETDEYFENTTLLLHGDGNQGATNFSNAGPPTYLAFKDNSSNNFPITVNGDAYGDNFGPFATADGYWSNYFNGSSDILVLNNVLAFGSNDFTWECWVYLTDLSSANVIVDYRPVTTNGAYFLISIQTDGTVRLYVSGAIRIDSTAKVQLNTWTHICVERSSGTTTMYINGVADPTTWSDSTTYITAANRPLIGRSGFSNASYLEGYLSNMRTVIGSPVYGGNFTPSTSPLTTTSQGVTASEVELLTCQSNRFIDNSSNNYAISLTGTPSTKVFNPFNTLPDGVNGSGYFDGTGDYIQAGSNAALAPGSGDFTIECWIYPTNNNFYNGIYQSYTDGNGRTTALRINTNNADQTSLMVQTAATALITTSTGVVTANAWNHIALVRNGAGSNNLVLYVNGTSAGTATNTTNFSDGYAQIGNAVYAGTNYYWNGGISNLRVVPGTAVYTSAFTPPTAPLTNVTNTQLLTCQYAGTVRNVGFIDSGPYDFLITRNGNTTQGSFSPFSKPDGRWGNYFDGSGDYLTTPNNVALQLGTGDFTVSAWVYPTIAFSSSAAIVSFGANQTKAWEILYASGTSSYAMYSQNGGGIIISGTSSVVANAWVYITVSRLSGTLRLFVNGVQEASVSDTSDLSATVGNLEVGSYAGVETMTGFISNLRIEKGNGYSTITVPTEPLTAISGTSLLTCQSNCFKDNSTNNFTITKNGDTKVTPFSPFPLTTAYSPSVNGGSGYFDGSGDNLTITSGVSKQFDPSAGFTLECWVYITNTTATQYVFEVRGSTADWNASTGIAFQLIPYHAGTSPRTCKWNFRNGVPTSISGSPAIEFAWNHVCVGYDGTTTRVWMNGTSIGSSTAAYSPPTVSNVSIGNNVSGTVPLGGYLSGLRFVQGVDIYGVGNTTITVPTAPSTTVSGTSLLCNFTNAGIYDSTGSNNLETLGNAQVDTNTVKFNTGAMKFDGSGDYCVGPNQPWMNFGSGNLTIECWVRFNSVSSTQMFVSSNYNASTGGGGWTFGYRADNTTLIFSVNANVQYGKTWTPSIDTWYFVTVCRDGTSLRFFVDGTQIGTTSTSSDNISGATTLMVGSNLTTPQYLNGYIDDLRITKGVARYTANFTVPSKAFPNIGV